MTNKIVIFYHLAQMNDWKNIYQEQMQSLVTSGLYDACDFIHIGINGNEPLPFTLDKIKIKYNLESILEAYTLRDLWNFCNENKDYKVLYFHAKGVSWSTESPMCSKINNFLFNVNSWRLNLEFFNIHKWKENVNLLEHYDCVGTEYKKTAILKVYNFEPIDAPHYSGNFWWANASFISNLDPNYLFDSTDDITRYRSELWIGTKKHRAFNWYNLDEGKEVYYSAYELEDYMNTEAKLNKKPKIVMVAMFRNESRVMRRMLESCYKYIDYWVIQNNGSTDGTDKIVKDFFEEHKIPGLLYEVEEGWVGFGWNRDHLIQKCQSIDHGCDWILKMDCDEILEVDDDFDWSPLENKDIQSFHITAISGSIIYYRAWMWNARLPWRFNHDTCHETIYCELDGVGENFQRYNLPNKIRQIGFNEGQSWQNDKKFISDALILEEKMIKEGTLLEDMYHFWYIGKSYYDSTECATFPLGDSQRKEYARRSIYYFEEFTRISHERNESEGNEMAYMALVLAGRCYKYLEQYNLAEMVLKLSERCISDRNDHLIELANVYECVKDYEKMYEVAKLLNSPERKNPFPNRSFLLNNFQYYDTGDNVQKLYAKSLSYINPETNLFSVNPLKVER